MSLNETCLRFASERSRSLPLCQRGRNGDGDRSNGAQEAVMSRMHATAAAGSPVLGVSQMMISNNGKKSELTKRVN